MSSCLYSWLLSKWLAVFLITVLVTPGLLEENPGAGPSNEEQLPKAKRRRLAVCKVCGFVARHEVRRNLSLMSHEIHCSRYFNVNYMYSTSSHHKM